VAGVNSWCLERRSAELVRLLELLCGFHYLTTFSKFYYLFENLLLLI